MGAVYTRVSLPEDLYQRLRQLAGAQHCTPSSIVAEALHARLSDAADAQADASPNAPAVAARLDARLEARLDKAIGEALVLKEILLVFIFAWLQHTPPIEDEIEDSAAMSANARFERYLDLVAQGVLPGKSIAARFWTLSGAASDAPFVKAQGENAL